MLVASRYGSSETARPAADRGFELDLELHRRGIGQRAQRLGVDLGESPRLAEEDEAGAPARFAGAQDRSLHDALETRERIGQQLELGVGAAPLFRAVPSITARSTSSLPEK